MKRVPLLLILLVILFGLPTRAQIALQYTDTTICPGQTIEMCAAFSGQASSLNTDDDFTAILEIGFPFVFFGNTYTQCLMSDNGFVSFDLSNANQYSAFTWNAAVGAGEADNAIHAAFQDGFLPAGGKLRYQSFGKPGSRRFIAEWCTVPKYGGSCNAFTFTTQIILYETSNIIEIHTTSLPGTAACPSTNSAFNGGNGIQGVRNQTGAVSYYTPNRAPADLWGTIGTINDARRFTPNGSGTYIIDSITFDPWIIIDEASSADLKWYVEGQPNLPIATGACATVTPTADIDYYTVRYDGGAGCNGGLQSFIDTVFIHYGTSYDTTQMEICAGNTYPWFGRTLFAPGNYDTLLTTTLGCDSFLRLQLIVNPLPNMTIKGSANVEICEGSSTILALASPQSNTTYQWYKDNAILTGETSSQLSVNAEGNYKVVGTTSKGCTDESDVFRLKINPNPVATIEPISDEVICAFDTLELTATAGTAYDYRWSPEKPFRTVTGAESQKVKGIFLESTQVTLTVYNQYGCYDSDTTMVQTKPCCEVFTPNAFSPNGDGLNEYFNPQLQLGQILLEMKIFDRYGKLIYNNTNLKKGWDGRYEDGSEASTDVYMYYIKYNCADGKIYEKRESLSLIR